MKIVVTGSNGYIGTRLVRLGSRFGHSMVGASRMPPSSLSVPWIKFDLCEPDCLQLTSGVDILVHLAANTLPEARIDEAIEVATAKKLIGAALASKVKFIFVSSQTARQDAPTSYGRIKWCIEQEVLAAGGWVVRPGQVYGGELRGLYGQLVKIVKKSPLLPKFLPLPVVQTIHVDDLAEGLLRIAVRRDLKSGVYCLGSSTPIPFSTFLAEIAKSRLRCRRAFVPLPIGLVNLFIAQLSETWRSRLGLDRLRSLFDLPVMNTEADLDQLGLSLRPLTSGLHPSGDGRRRQLLREANALITYVLKERPSNSMLRRYVRAVEGSRVEREFRLLGIFLSYPILLSLLDKKSWPDPALGSEFFWRMDAATLMSESTPEGAVRFLGYGQSHGPLTSTLSIVNAIAGDALWRLVRIFVAPILRYSFAKVKGGI